MTTDFLVGYIKNLIYIPPLPQGQNILKQRATCIIASASPDFLPRRNLIIALRCAKFWEGRRKGLPVVYNEKFENKCTK